MILLHLFGNEDRNSLNDFCLKCSEHKEKGKGLSDNMVKNNVICL